MAQTDREALIAFYTATDGPNWKNSTGWDTDVDLSDWYGVKTNDQGRVVELSLVGNNLRGPIPPELGNLSNLQKLDLSHPFGGGGLTGPIPPELGNLAALQYLHLQDNGLSGQIPPELGALSKLQVLRLDGNKHTGPIPPELGNLAALQTLNLGYNQLSGAIPPDVGNLRSLKELRLWINQLSGPIPPELGNLTALQRLGLDDNGLRGSIPQELGKLAALQDLSLSYNQLTGTIPLELGKLTALSSLNLRRNQLSGSIPPELGKLAALQELNLWGNHLTGPLPPELAKVTTLLGIDVRNNQLTGPLPLNGSRQELQRWRQRVTGQIEDVEHAHAARAVNVLTSFWHFCLPVLDDATDLWLLLETFGRSHRGLWWTCLCVFIMADIERVYTALFFVALLVSMILSVVDCGCVDLSGCMSFLAGGDVNVYLPCGHLLLDSLLWTLLGSRARSSPFMHEFGLAGASSGRELRVTGLGLHAIDVMVFFHPFRYFGEFVMSFPRGHRRAEMVERNEAHRRKISMVRAVGETLCVDPLFLALSVVTAGWDDNVTGLAVFSALFSVLELVTELQYYVSEADAGNSLSSAAVSDVEGGVGASASTDSRPMELVGSSHG